MLSEKNYNLIQGWVNEYWNKHDSLSDEQQKEQIWVLSKKVCDLYPRYPKQYLYNLNIRDDDDIYGYWLMAMHKTMDYMKRKDKRDAKTGALLHIAMYRLRDVLIELKVMKRGGGGVILENFEVPIDGLFGDAPEYKIDTSRNGASIASKGTYQYLIDALSYSNDTLLEKYIDMGIDVPNDLYGDGYANIYDN